jgi:hypothetical protein
LDLQDERVVSHKEGVQLAEDIGAIGYFEASAKTGDNVDDVFTNLTKNMLIKGLNIDVDEAEFKQ